MSTRGSVAWKAGRRVVGVYNHSDSYPTVLGAEVLATLKKRGVEETLALLSGLGDWREIESGGVCQYCGKRTGQPHSISGAIFGFGSMARRQFVAMRKSQSKGRPDLWAQYEKEIATLDAITADRQRTGYPDPDAKMHKHGDGPKDQFNPFKDAIFMEWVYIINPKLRVVEVWKSVERTPEAEARWPRWSRCRDSSSGRVYSHVHIADVPVDGEPDWQRIEDMGRSAAGQSPRSGS